MQANRALYFIPRTIHSCQKNIDSPKQSLYYREVFAIEPSDERKINAENDKCSGQLQKAVKIVNNVYFE
jgi:hypothetical protein